MPRITVLDEHTINKIAAGEVIERPASVVKELLENAIDAQATAVTVEIRDGGTSLIRVTDNGCGIPKDEVGLAFLPHATSKIKSVEDLFTVASLGFRGEALASIAAVAQVELISKTADALTGTRYQIEGGKEKSVEEIGAPEGTTFLVRNLFYNTPARKNFLKTPQTEGAYVSDLVEKIALSHPDISIRFIQNNQNKLHTSGNHNLKDIIYTVFGREIAANLLPVEVSHDILQIRGFAGKPVIARGNRNYENYYINGRYIKSNVVAKAIEEAYRPFMMQHKYPFTLLHLTIEPEYLDVNVHPTKMELRFREGERIYQMIYRAVSDALAHKELIPEVSLEEKKEEKKTASLIRTPRPEPFETRRRDEVERPAAGSKRLIPADRPEAVPGARELEFSKERVPEKEKAGEQPGGLYRTKPAFDFLGELGAAGSGDRTRYTASAGSAASWLTGNTETAGSGPAIPSKGQPADTNLGPDTGISENQLSDTKPSPATPADPQPADTKLSPATPANLQPADTKLSSATSAKSQPSDTDSSPAVSPADQPAAAESAAAKPEQMDLFEEKLLEPKSRLKHKLIGQLFDTYWLVEFNEQLFIIDQHAAHEKVLYEKTIQSLKERDYTSQMINPPIILTLSMNEEILLNRHLDYFTTIGFEIEHFGGREYAVRAVPGNLFSIAKKELLMEMIDSLSEEGSLHVRSAEDDDSSSHNANIIYEKIASMSCKAAVKGNNRLSVMEANELIDQLLDLENPYACPHGRPTIISMTKYELEKKFKRIV